MEIDGRIGELIEAAVLSGAYSALAKEIPAAERGLMKMYWKHHARTAILCGQIGASAVMAAGSRE